MLGESCEGKAKLNKAVERETAAESLLPDVSLAVVPEL